MSDSDSDEDEGKKREEEDEEEEPPPPESPPPPQVRRGGKYEKRESSMIGMLAEEMRLECRTSWIRVLVGKIESKKARLKSEVLALSAQIDALAVDIRYLSSSRASPANDTFLYGNELTSTPL